MNSSFPFTTSASFHQAESHFKTTCVARHFAHISYFTYPAYLSTGPVLFGGELQLKLAEVGLGWPTRVKCSCSLSGGAAKVWNEADVLVVMPATLAVISQ